MPTTLPSPLDRGEFRFVTFNAAGAEGRWIDGEMIWVRVGEVRRAAASQVSLARRGGGCAQSSLSRRPHADHPAKPVDREEFPFVAAHATGAAGSPLLGAPGVRAGETGGTMTGEEAEQLRLTCLTTEQRGG